MKHVLEGSVTPADRRKSPFVYLPFEVAAGTTRLEVAYRHDAGNILDIGILDPTVAAFPSQTGFRGWSGGARQSFFVASDEATPGYIPGEMMPGTWQILLGLAHVGTDPCHYRIEIHADETPRPLIAPPQAVPVAKSAGGWYKGDLQSHTHHSDAKGSLADLAAAARARGLDFLAVTDHNTYSHHRPLAEASSPDLLLLPGLEVTTYRGHANVWGVEGWVDFRILSDSDLPTLIEQVQRRGGLFSVNHPKVSPNCIGCDWEYPIPEEIDCMEVWQGPWLYRNWDSLARYDHLLRSGRRVTLVGGSDRHQPGWPDPAPDVLQVGSPTTWLRLETLSVPAVLATLRAGRAFVSESPQGPQLEIFLNNIPMGQVVPQEERMQARATIKGAKGDTLRWVGSSGILREVPIEGADYEDSWRLEEPQGYLRAEIVSAKPDMRVQAFAEILERGGKLPEGLTVAQLEAADNLRALSNPVYVENSSG